MRSWRTKLETLTNLWYRQDSQKQPFHHGNNNEMEDGTSPHAHILFSWEIQPHLLMTNMVQSAVTNEHITAWVRGLLSIAWADGVLEEEEKEMISNLTHTELASLSLEGEFTPITPSELATVLGHDPHLGENFLRTGLMVALADGIYSVCEDELLHQYCRALGLKIKELESLLHNLEIAKAAAEKAASGEIHEHHEHHHIDVLKPVKTWLDAWDIHDPKVAHVVCKMIPPQCPFERDITIFGRKIAHIPPMCKINPLYEQLMGLRFRALSYLADECHEDISEYC
ncbi:MAG: hypothetical protein RLZZ338_3055 [Cyanobacteriota bacterium]